LAAHIIDEKAYFLKMERTYPVAEFINNTLPEDSLLIVVFEPRLFYFDRKILIYDIWKRTHRENLTDYINGRLELSKKPVYLLHDHSAPRDEIEGLIKGKRPIYRMSREGDNGAIASYGLYRIN
jgi:hypothetical protein